jgi:peptidoglycan/LPS O-acetylase OafA/YrhL
MSQINMMNYHINELHNLKPIEYRADIDGLRAIAVLFVIAFHAFPNTLPGGFIGVDVFFLVT